jgi:patatin-like phospholipase/acyl hydrolase
MTELNLRQHVALAFDGGGVRGIIPAMALTVIEKALNGSTGKPIIDSGQVKIVTGTSTGAIIAASVAIGMTASEIVEMYKQIPKVVFQPRRWEIINYARGLFGWSRYTTTEYKKLLREHIGEKTGNPDITLRQLHQEKLAAKKQVLVMTTMNVYERRTKFIKSSNKIDCFDSMQKDETHDNDGDWMLWEAIMASSAAPTYFPPLMHMYKHPNDKGDIQSYYVDGGTGSYNDPADIAAREAVEWQCLEREHVSLLSFGTGAMPEEDYRKQNPNIPSWSIIGWIKAMMFDLMMVEAARAQSLDVLENYVTYNDDNTPKIDCSIDYRRFQAPLNKNVDLDSGDDATMEYLQEQGAKLIERIQCGRYLCLENLYKLAHEEPYDDVIDPVRIAPAWKKMMQAPKRRKA